MRSFKKIFLLVAVIGIAMPVFVFAQNGDFGLQDAAKGTDLIGRGADVNADQALPELIGTIVGVVLSFVGAAFFLLILYAGLLWMMAFGNTERVDRAKSIVEHAAIGLIIVLAAYAISRFVFGALTKPTEQEAATGQGAMGCCFNPTTNNRIQNLESQCVPNAQNPRTWTPGACPEAVAGCCYLNDYTACDSNIIESNCPVSPGPQGTSWRAGGCPVSCNQ